MDKIDNKILTELDINPKISISKLARKARISQQVADYRIKRMLENREITNFGTIINLKALGMEHYRIFFTFNSRKEFSVEKIFEYLRNKKGNYWAARIGGKYDLLVALFVKDFEEFDSFIDDFNQNFPGLVKDYKSCYGIDHRIYKHKYLSKDYSFLDYGYNDKIKKIDEIDYKILKRINNNCRLSSLEISKEIKVSYKTIINRIRNLEKEKIILGYRLFIRSKEKNPFVILFSFKDYSRQKEKNLIEYLGRSDAVTQLVRLFGIWNLFINARAENIEKIQNLLIDIRDRFDIIDNYEIIPIFEDISINLFAT